ncbi:BrnA antitoxin family protein [Amaricoccus sp. W119]|uniref:BrnA antitoxin family protein n=1 Tax=Amaricoccus sp. W119 TaxID=3391833 RepID=UPI0039A71A42
MAERKRAERGKGVRPRKSEVLPAEVLPVAEIRRDLDTMETWNAERRLKERGLPEGWDALAWDLPAEPAKTKMTLRLDREVIDWYAALGPDHGARINAVLRLYMLGVQSREIESPEQFDWRGTPVAG